MNSFTDWEVKQRDDIKKLIEEKDFDEARARTAKFLKSVKTRVKRRALLRTIPFWVTAMNNDF